MIHGYPFKASMYKNKFFSIFFILMLTYNVIYPFIPAITIPSLHLEKEITKDHPNFKIFVVITPLFFGALSIAYEELVVK